MSEILWSPGPDRIAGANITRFTAMVRERHGLNADDYAALHRWSIENRAAFWSAVWDYGEVIGDRGDGPILTDGDRMPGAKWFPERAPQLRREPASPASTTRPQSCFAARTACGYALSFRRVHDEVSDDSRRRSARPG